MRVGFYASRVVSHQPDFEDHVDLRGSMPSIIYHLNKSNFCGPGKVLSDLKTSGEFYLIDQLVSSSQSYRTFFEL